MTDQAQRSKLRNNILIDFPFQPTDDQLNLLDGLVEFVLSENKDEIFLLKGYAGTGKTTVISKFVNKLWSVKKKFRLLAPTGRAAKVIASYSGQTAFTIHRMIYRPKVSKGSALNFIMQANKHRDTIFIVDEASMISNKSNDLVGQRSLLEDLIQYVDQGKNCKLILVGDDAQLPPVNSDLSPALDKSHLEFFHEKKVFEYTLREVLRQEAGSGVLLNATLIREQIESSFYGDLRFDLQNQSAVVRLIDGYDIESAISSSYNDFNIDDTTIIVRSNKRANLYNQQIRNRIRMLDSEISAGDILMVVKNNYYWLDAKSGPGFIANGDTIEVMSINSIQELYGFRFAEAEVRMVDYPDQEAFNTVLLLDTLAVDGPSLSYEDSNKLYNSIKEDYLEFAPSTIYKKIKENIYYNALQVKFAYAITCHKSQGGQWENVFIEQAWLPNGEIDLEYLRWIYTAFTRAKTNLYLIGFGDEWFL